MNRWTICLLGLNKPMRVLIVCLAVSAVLGQQLAPDAVFRTTTKLVEVRVIAEEKQGNDQPAKPVIRCCRAEFRTAKNLRFRQRQSR
jgi:hypothetical protein